jgi:drug/metabolite transporter (DMT)-like permease
VGVTFALLSMTLFSIANITVIRGFDGKTRSSGAFLSIVITFVLSLAIWLFQVSRNGWSPVSVTAVAWFALAGVLTIFIGRVFLYASIQRLGAVRASAIKRLNPFFSVLLGVLLLGEAVTRPMLAGMILIAIGFAVLVRQSLQASSGQADSPSGKGVFHRMLNLGYLYGPVSAFAYASGYVARKEGLLILPDAALGTMIGALTGIIVFTATACLLRNYRDDLRQTFTTFNPWLWVAGVMSSLGQICYFVALSYSSISKISLITSMEVFVTIFLSMVIFRSKEKLTFDVIIAGLLGTAGTVFVILN